MARRLFVVVIALLGVVAGVPAHAETTTTRFMRQFIEVVADDAAPAEAVGGFRLFEKGQGALAVWNTLPTDGEPQPGVVYTDTLLVTSTRVTLGNDMPNEAAASVVVIQLGFTFDPAGNFVLLYELIARASDDDIDLEVSRDLTEASLTASVTMQMCNIEGCHDAGTSTLTASWTGVGGLQRQRDHFVIASRAITDLQVVIDFFRQATATGELDGVDFGSQLEARIFAGSLHLLVRCHVCQG